jgi:predicted DNA binding CopG/RHH family protein
VEEPMSTENLPQTDSIREMAEFWDTHDLTDFEDQLVEVTNTAFQQQAEVKIHLPLKEAKTIQQLANAKGIDSADLIRQWVLEKVKAS